MLGNPTVYWNAIACLKIHCYNFQTRSRASLQEYVIGTCQFLAIVRRNCRTASGKWADFQTELGTAFAIFILQISPIQLQLTYTSSWILNVWMVASIFLQSIPANAGAVKGWLQNLLLRAHTYSGIFLPDSADFGSSPPLWDYGRAIGRASCWFYGICAVCCVGKHRIKKNRKWFRKSKALLGNSTQGIIYETSIQAFHDIQRNCENRCCKETRWRHFQPKKAGNPWLINKSLVFRLYRNNAEDGTWTHTSIQTQDP